MRIRTGFSFHHAVGHLEEVADRLVEIGWSSAPISDRKSTFGFARWTKVCDALGLAPIYGVELGVKRLLSEPGVDYWSFFARDPAALHELIAVATKKQYLTHEQLDMVGDHIVQVIGKGTQPALVTPRPDVRYVALSPSTPYGQYRQAQEHGHAFVASSDNRYPTADLDKAYELALGRRADDQTFPQHILSSGEWIEACPLFDEMDRVRAMENLDALLERMPGRPMRQGKLIHPEVEANLRTKCEDALHELHLPDRDVTTYVARLERELDVIAEKGFEDYFHILQDLVGWARQRMVVGPARGSAGGSLVCYLLGITTIDPIKYDLLFERFIDTNRNDLPDIDIDFPDNRREEVFQYARQRYGVDHVARLGTIGTFAGRSAINRVGQTLRIPQWRLNELHDDIDNEGIMHALGQTEKGVKLSREHPWISVAGWLQGHPQNAGQHAAGLLVTDEPVSHYVAVDSSTHAAWCDLKDADALGLLKIDALGLTTLGVFENALERIGPANLNIRDLNTLSWDDPAAFAILNDRKFSGIFQFTGAASRSLSQGVTFKTLEDLVAVTSLARPGPLKTGEAHKWVERRMGRQPTPPAEHEIVADITRDTYGVLIYQEQLMRIVRELAYFDWPEVNAFRKAVSKKTDLDVFRAKFVEGAKRNVGIGTATELFNRMESFGEYGFNRSHAVAYSMVAYQCCWLKAYFPLEFAAATLDAETDPDKQIAMLRELEAEGVSYVPVDPDRSADRWAIDYEKRRLVGPLTAISGIGPAKVGEIMAARNAGTELRPALAKQLKAAKTAIDTLWPIRDRLAGLPEDPFEAGVMKSTPISRIDPIAERAYLVRVKITRVYEKNGNLHLFAADDSGECFMQVKKSKRDLMEYVKARAVTGKSYFAFFGLKPGWADFRMIAIDKAHHYGDDA